MTKKKTDDTERPSILNIFWELYQCTARFFCSQYLMWNFQSKLSFFNSGKFSTFISSNIAFSLLHLVLLLEFLLGLPSSKIDHRILPSLFLSVLHSRCFPDACLIHSLNLYSADSSPLFNPAVCVRTHVCTLQL